MGYLAQDIRGGLVLRDISSLASPSADYFALFSKTGEIVQQNSSGQIMQVSAPTIATSAGNVANATNVMDKVGECEAALGAGTWLIQASAEFSCNNTGGSEFEIRDTTNNATLDSYVSSTVTANTKLMCNLGVKHTLGSDATIQLRFKSSTNTQTTSVPAKAVSVSFTRLL